jgi:hypothetical protein
MGSGHAQEFALVDGLHEFWFESPVEPSARERGVGVRPAGRARRNDKLRLLGVTGRYPVSGTLAGLFFGGLGCGRTVTSKLRRCGRFRFPFGANKYASRISNVHWWELPRPHFHPVRVLGGERIAHLPHN